MGFNFNKEKIIYFYESVVKYYPSDIQKTYWGTEEDLINAIIIEDYSVEDDDIVVILKNGRLLFPKALFEFLFTGEEFCVFDSAVGDRFNYRGFTFIELNESPLIRIKTGEKISSGLFPITSDDSGNTESCFFVNDENEIFYPSEIISFFVAQLQNRLKKSLNNFPENFLYHFEQIKYAIRIKNGKDNLCTKLLYKLSAELGLIENKIVESNKIPINFTDQDLKNIIDGITDDIPDDNSQNLLPLNCFISAVGNTNPYYRFLDIYHIFESLFYKHFYSYVIKLSGNSFSIETYNSIKKHMKEGQMLKLVLIDSLEDDENLRREIKKNLLNYSTNELLKKIGYNIDVKNWPTDNVDDFCDNLAENLIYKLRNAIAHSKRTDDHIEKINESSDLIENFIGVTNVIIDLSKKIIDKNIVNW